ncbi:MAG TPA: S4 domain-containing protein [Steroidobacteraceae bacterium]|nr:S4 domain-containing protein [Steroidobacteraceae bacterium]HRX89644.1 S4 domain-containing protein [Steroidobacteraceae bacterium]
MSSRPDSAQGGERLQKALAQLGLGSRREIETWIRAGRLTINGTVATLGARVEPADDVRLDGRAIRRRHAAPQQVYLCHRSPGDESFVDRLPKRAGRRFMAISPMPRIDGGLELLTADGALALELQRSVKEQVSEFSARVNGVLTATQLAAIELGQLDGARQVEVQSIEAVEVEEESTAANRWYLLRTRGASGKDVRQLLERQGAIISRILRTHFGPLPLERSLARGQFRPLTAAELAALLPGRQAAAPRPRAVRSAGRRKRNPSRRD